jgi:hypothetical protein
VASRRGCQEGLRQDPVHPREGVRPVRTAPTLLTLATQPAIDRVKPRRLS